MLTTLLLAAAVAAGPRPAPPYGPPITLEQAKVVVAAAEAEARRRGAAVTIAVVEPSGAVTLMQRMTGATYAGVEGAPAKARSAALWKRSTASWIAEMSTGAIAPVTFAGVVAADGGEMLIANGLVVGAIGVAGPGAQPIAEAGVAALQ